MSCGTPYIDFHFGKSTADYTSRIIESAAGKLNTTGAFNVGGVLSQNGTDVMSAINNRIKIAQLAVTFSGGSATISISGASSYGAAMAQNISNNDYIITRVSHSSGSDELTILHGIILALL